MAKIGFVTIGQSPRDDILNSMLPQSLHASVLQSGALDNLTRDVISSLQPEPSETPFVTRLADDTEVLVDKSRLIPHLQAAVNSVIKAGVHSVAILCTGSFPQIESPVPLIFPDRILNATVHALLPTGVVGVVMPHLDQMELMRSKWETAHRSFVGVAASPYSSSGKLLEYGQYLDNEGADIIVLDCMGFTSEMKQAVASGTQKPVILANRLTGRIIEELIT
jgi:protein AroM